jgi:hypothetical protein
VIELNDLLVKVELDPAKVMVMRHRPTEPALRNALPWLAEEQPEVFNSYQRIQGPRVEKSLAKASHLVSTLGHESGKALFVGVYEVRGAEPMALATWRRLADNERLTALGHRDPERETIQWFDLDLTETLSELKGRLVLSWSGIERSWWRWAARNTFPVHAIREESALVGPMPHWSALVLDWAQLSSLPRSWRAALSQWRGVYFILDGASGRGYVGSAYGADNLMARWQQYGETGHGGNVELRGLDPKQLRFSILERVSPDLPADDVIRVEASWKARLGTREHGLNRN